jgi:signal transduction histidine kinase
VQEERQRLSRELHDSVSQALYSIALGSKTARTLLDRDPLKAVEPIDFTLAQAERGLAEMRALILELRPEMIEQEGLTGALQRQADALAARHRLDVQAVLCGEPDLPMSAKEALYRIAQEALHNTIKHAGASKVIVSLECAHGDVVLEIRDNGVGFDTSRMYHGHVGLQSMRERAEVVGGIVRIQSRQGAGTQVQVTLPGNRDR